MFTRHSFSSLQGLLSRAMLYLGLFGMALFAVIRWQQWSERGRDFTVARLAVLADQNTEPFDGALTDGFGYGFSDRHAPRRDVEPARLSALAAAAQLEQQVLRAPTPANTHAWGVAQLLLRKYEQGISSLARAAEEAPFDARMHNDLAVAYLARARAEERAEDWLQAMASVERATHLDPSSSEALFNRALITEAMGLPHEAIRSWVAYLAHDSRSEWRPEVERRLAKLRGALTAPGAVVDRLRHASEAGDIGAVVGIASGQPQVAREFAEDRLLPDWGADVLARRETRAAQTLAAARAIARAVQRYDRSLADAIAAIDACQTSSRSALERLGHAYERFGEARRLYEANAVTNAVPVFVEAERLFGRAVHPFALWSRLHVAIAAYYRGEYAAVRVSMAALERTARQRRYLIVAARAAWMQGLTANLESDFQSALQHFERAEQVFATTGEIYNRAAVQNLLAGIYLYVGSKRDVWRLSLAALNGSQDDPSYRRRHTQLMSAAYEAVRGGVAAAAIVFEDEAVRLDQEWTDPAALAELHSYRARTLAALDRRLEAEETLAVARARVESVTDSLLRQRLEAELLQTEAEVLVKTDPRRGIEAASRAIGYFAPTKSSLRLPRLYLARGRAWEMLGAHDRALEDFTAAAERFESERKMLPRSQELRLSHVDELWTVYPALVDASQRSGASCQGLLAAAERGRAFNLREAWERQPLDGAFPAVAADEVILHYTFLADRLLILTLYRDGCDIHVVPVTKRQIERAGLAWTRALTDQSDERVGRELFDSLVGPAWTRISRARRLGVVADGPIHHLPLAALPIGSNRRLIHQLEVRLYPTLALRGADGRRSAGMKAKPGVALVTSGGDPVTGSLPRLPFAAPEAAAVRRLLIGAGMSLAAATQDPLARQLSSARLFHFAGHAVINPMFPLLSRLMFSRFDEPWITAQEIADMRPSNLQLVVLSACETDRGEVFGGDGPASLARAFLSAGARDVIATLWPVQDQATLGFVTTFYRRWLQDDDAPTALREAMLSTMTSGNQDWAAWVVVSSQ